MDFLTKYLLKRFLRKQFAKANEYFAIREVGKLVLFELEDWYTEDSSIVLKNVMLQEMRSLQV